jgi:hypothetical protein
MKGTVREQSLAANKQKGRGQYFPVLWTLWLQGSADQSEVRLFLQKHYPNESPAQIEDRWNSLNSWASTASPEERQLRVDPGLATPMAHPVKNALRFLEETVVFEGVENEPFHRYDAVWKLRSQFSMSASRTPWCEILAVAVDYETNGYNAGVLDGILHEALFLVVNSFQTLRHV